MYFGRGRWLPRALLLAVLVVYDRCAAEGEAAGGQELLEPSAPAWRPGSWYRRALLSKDGKDNIRDAAPKIAGGTVVPCGRYPFMVSLRDATNDHKCGGILVDPYWVLTAAHCVDPNNSDSLGLSPITVVGPCNLGDRENEAGKVEMAIPKTTIIHPDFTGDVMDGGDIALLKLGSPSNHTPIALPPANVTVRTNSALVVLGWGRGLSGEKSMDLHQGTNMQVVPNSICGADQVWGNVIREEMLCAFARAYDGDTCDGDSGGPVLRAFAPHGKVNEGKPELDVLFGVTSFGEKGVQCGESQVPGVYTSVPYHVDWINEQIKGSQHGSVRPAIPPDETLSKEADAPEPLPSPGVIPTQEAPQPSIEGPSVRPPPVTAVPLARPSPRQPASHKPPTKPTVLAPAPAPDLDLLPGPAPKVIPEPAKAPPEESPAEPEAETAVPEVQPHSPPVAVEEGFAPKRKGIASPSQNEQPVSTVDELDEKILSMAADVERSGMAVTLNKMLAKGGDPNACCASAGRSALHETTLHDNVAAARALLARGATVDVVDDRGQTPLHLAASRNAPAVALVLIHATADPNAEDDGGKTPLHSAAAWGNWKVAEILLESGADQNILDDEGRLPMDLICATRCKKKEHLKKLQRLLLVAA